MVRLLNDILMLVAELLAYSTDQHRPFIDEACPNLNKFCSAIDFINGIRPCEDATTRNQGGFTFGQGCQLLQYCIGWRFEGLPAQSAIPNDGGQTL
jgi:hypothetical protein